MSTFELPENYTPGPWLRESDTIYALTDYTAPGGIHWRNREERVRVNRFDTRVSSSGYDAAPRDEISANAALIALAPAMAAEIRRLERENAALRDAMENLAAVLLNLGRGVQLGQAVWYVKASEAMANVAQVLAPAEPMEGETP